LRVGIQGLDEQCFSSEAFNMMNPGWISRLLSEKHSLAAARCIVGGMATAILGLTAGTAVAQLPIFVSHQTAPDGYTLHESIDLGGRAANIDGSGAMYDTLVNQQSGPRIMGETFELRALPHTKNTLVDHLKGFSSGFGGDPNNVAKLDVSKGKLYDFSGLFRRDRQYFDYNLLGNPNLPPGQSIPIGPAAAPTGSYAWPQVTQSPFMFNTVRRMTDTKLTLLPLSKVTFRAGYSQNVFQGPSLSPSGYQVAGSYDLLLQEYQRNSTDDWTGSVEWKPVSRTRLTYEEQVTHYKGDSYFSMAPQYFNLQEADGFRVAVLQNYDNPINKPVGITCNAGVGPAPISPKQSPNGLPIVDPACNVIASYSRSQPTREIFPTEIFRLQSSSIKDVTMNGNVRYTNANTSLPNYYDNFQGLAGTTRELTYAGNARAKREAIATDYGVTWQMLKKFSISEQIDYSNVHQPGVANITSLTTVTSATPNINSTTLTTTVINTPINPASQLLRLKAVRASLRRCLISSARSSSRTTSQRRTTLRIAPCSRSPITTSSTPSAKVPRTPRDTCPVSPTSPSTRTAVHSASLCGRRTTGTSTVRSSFCTPTMSSPRSHPASFSITEFTPLTGQRPGRRSPARTMTSSATTIRTIQAQRPLMARSSTSIIAAS
jgi:hypothetical protein